ncbi:unnamed protein product, partial [Haemonchus placei]|uniref:Phlebovirus_G2 domain-containing protein n=1 Tax=Haemonchus placei TaxID=6290 RepID=A0A0N4X2B8_HAEPC
MRADCECSPAENQVVCRCEEDDVRKAFSNIEQVLPLIHQQKHFSQHPHHAVIAKVEQDVTPETTLNLKEAVTDVRTENEDDICFIENTDLTGCYQCNKGARALVICKSTYNNVSAEVECRKGSFTIPSGQKSQLNFLFDSVYILYSVRCGLTPKQFEVKEILTSIQKDIGELTQKTISQDEAIKSILERIDSLCIAKANREQEPDLDPREHENESLQDNEASETQGKEVEPKEDLELLDDDDLELDNEPEDLELRRPTDYPGHFQRLDLEERMTELWAFLRSHREVPERKFREVELMREQDCYLICSFCLAKGQHYSNS